MSDLFEFQSNPQSQPLAEVLRPQDLSQFIGQTEAELKLKQVVENLKTHSYLPNLILWGPPGSGKTTWARLIGQVSKFEFLQINAIETGAKELRDLGNQAQRRRLELQKRTILFIDEIHRLNRGQQDVLLPFTEKGDLLLIGATTENPSYELNSALLSRCQLIVFKPHQKKDLIQILNQASQALKFDFINQLSQDAISFLIESADGDARKLINSIELIYNSVSQLSAGSQLTADALSSDAKLIELDSLLKLLSQNSLRYDRSGESHYDTLSAFIKSLRGSDPDAAIYYLARMIKGGEDPKIIARRMIILASEDIGNADPKALPLAVATLSAVEAIGLPEAGINLAQTVTYLASAPKSNASYVAYKKALAVVEKSGSLEIPLHLRNAQTPLMKELGYGRNYQYAHNFAKGYAQQTYLPHELKNEKFYEPSDHGFEKNILNYLNWLKS